MKKHRRTEITAFRRRVLIVSGEPAARPDKTEVRINDAASSQTIETGSDEGQEILIDAIKMLQENLQTDSSRN